MDRIGTKAFKTYMDRHDGHQTNAGNALGYSAARINQVISGVRPMSDALAARIHAVTGGEISMFDLSINLRKLERKGKCV